MRDLQHPLPWNRNKGVGVGVDFGLVPRYPGGYHKGIDMHAPVGEPVLAAADGAVTYADDTGGDYGIKVVIDHGDGLTTTYGHLDELWVQVGDDVEVGDEIGACGNTGNSRGPHLHFEVAEGGELQDPMEWIKPRPSFYGGAWLRSS